MSKHEISFDIVIIGGGVIGVACAYSISKKYKNKSILLIEQHERLGTETTARNSEVIHAGLYYKEGSLKEKFCLEGKPLLYDFCQSNEIAFQKCEKLVVAHDEVELEELQKMHQRAKDNFVPTKIIDESRIKSLEPNINAKHALLSTSTGIIDSEEYTQRLALLSEQNGVLIFKQSKCLQWTKLTQGYELLISQPGSDKMKVHTDILINSAGLGAFDLSKNIFGEEPPFLMSYVRGHYFHLSNKFKNITKKLIYPLPDTKGGGLGIHLTLDLEGMARLGPDTDWRQADRVDLNFYDEDIEPLTQKFLKAVTRYLPNVNAANLTPGFVGVRPKLIGFDGKQLGDFYIAKETDRGHSGWINLLGIESPGLTSSLAIANHVTGLI